ncbi:MAG: amidase [Burkholderiaceae bacterium]
MTETISPKSSRIREAVAAIADGRSSAREQIGLARAALETHARLNPIAHVDWSRAEAIAAELDARRDRGEPLGRLHGIPISIKDLYVVEGMPTRAGTRAALPALGAAEAVAVARLRAAGAIPFAKTNMHEIALGATGENLWTGDVCNPFDPTRQAGGSSSGAAVCVAVGAGYAGLGSDTGGSVRIPAAFCGVTGFKPSFGAIPLEGALYLSWTCDHAGPIARCVDDCALLYEVMSGRRASHGQVVNEPTIGVPVDWLDGRLEPTVREAFEGILARLERAGAQVREIALPVLKEASNNYTTLVRAEAAWVHRDALAAGDEGFSALVRPPLEAGLAVGAAQYIDALKFRDRLRRELGQALAKVDALMTPTTAILPPPRGRLDTRVEGGEISVREAVLGQTLPFSYAGLPTLSLPAAMIDGLPLGMQVVGAADADARLLALGRWLEGHFAK